MAATRALYGRPGERGALLTLPGRPALASAPRRGKEGGGAGEPLRWTCDFGDGGRPRREYAALVPWDTLACLLIALIALSLALFAPLPQQQEPELHDLRRPPRGPPSPVAGQPRPLVVEVVLWLGLVCVLAAMGQMPTKVVREVDTFIVQFPLHRCVVPVMEVLELVMVGELDQFTGLLVRWGVFPFGLTFRCFRGLPTTRGAMCALLTTRCLWSFLFCLEDPIQFLVDNQKPLDKEARYRTVGRALVREGELLTTRKVCEMRRGSFLRIERQSGRRVFVHFEGGKVSGWMSYINQLGHFLLEKERSIDQPAPGTVGASELARDYGATIELSSLQEDGQAE